MTMTKEQFFELPSFAVIGNSSRKPFPKLTYGFLRERGKTLFPVDLGGASEVLGDRAYAAVADLPDSVAAAIVELPRDDVLAAVREVDRAGIKDLWLHMGSESAPVLAFCEKQGIRLHYGNCAVMYVHTRPSYHTIHKLLWKLLKKY